MTLYDQVQEAVAAIRTRTTLQPSVAIILGSGLGDLAAEISNATAIPYAEIPHFLRSTVPGHAGRLLIGHLEEVPVVMMHALGAQTLIVTNAAGGVNAAYGPGDFMLIRDHIGFPTLSGANPLIGPNDDRLGERFPGLANAYDEHLREIARSVAAQQADTTLREGVYVMVGGPQFETRAELLFLRMIGADAVGMSTVPEVVVALPEGVRVL